MSDLDIGNLNSNQNYLGLVDSNDPFNLYKFSLNSPGKVGVSLTGLSGNADLQILDNSEKVLYSSASSDTSNEVIAIDNLAAGNYTIRINQVSGKTNYNLSLTIEEIEKIQVDVITGLNIESGYFIVGETGQVGVDFINDGGKYKGELAIFSLAGIDNFTPGSAEFIKEAANRALSNSNLGYIVISDSKEGAKFNVGLANADNDGEYKGIKTFAMKPGDTFGVMLVPNGKVEEVFNKPDINGNKRPLFSLVTANPNEAFHLGQVADINGMGSAFAIEDQRVDKGTDKDYNDVIFQLTGATGKAVNLDEVINPENDWRDSTLGKDLIDYVHKKELAIDPNPPIDTTPVDPNPPIDTTPVDPNPPIDTTPVDPKLPIDTIPVDSNPTIDNTPVDPKLPVDTTPQIDRNQPLIGVIDTGFSGNNPDLDYRRFLLGSDRISQDNNPLLSPGEGSEHGTHILGLIAATQGNEIGIDGINDKAPIWLGRAVGSGNWADSLIEFVDAAKQSGQKNAIVNLSLDLTQINQDGSVTTRYELTPKEREAIEYARQNHVLIVTAAGNDGGVMSVLGQASQEFDNIITVGASDGSDRANYSSYGAGLDIVTEGGTIYKPVLSTVKDDVGMIVGTSAAAAKATGVASLVWAANPDLNFKQVIQILESTATDLKTSGWDGETGFGLLNSAAAVELAKNTAGENYTPEPWVTPFTWDGEGKVTPTERAAEGGISIATAPQFSPTFSDNDKVDSTTPEKYYQFTVNQPGYVRWTLTRTNGSDEFPGAAVVKADSTPGRFKFVPGGAMLSGSVDGQTTPISRTDGVFVDPGTYYLKLQNGITNTVKNYNLSNQFIPDSISTFQTPVNYSTTPYFDFSPDIQTKAFNGSSATGLNVSGQVEFKFGDLSKRTAKYGLEVKETGKLNFNVLSPNGMVEVRVEKFIGSEDKTENLAYYEFAANANYSNEITLNKGRYQIEIKANGDEVIPGQILQLPYTLTGVFSRIAPEVGEGNVPIGAGNFIKTVTSNGVDTHYYTNGHLSVQPKGTSTWYTSGTGTAIPILNSTITPIEAPPDYAGNTLGSARDLGKLSVNASGIGYSLGASDFVGDADKYDYYRFNFDQTNNFNLRLDGLSADAKVELIQDRNNNGQVDFGEVLETSAGGNAAQLINRTPLEKDTYYVRVSSNKAWADTNYTLGLTAAAIPDKAGNTLDKAFNLGNLTFRQTFQQDFLHTNDRNDFYRFDLTTVRQVDFAFDSSRAIMNLYIIQDKNNNNQIEYEEVSEIGSVNSSAGSFSITLEPGTYYALAQLPRSIDAYTNYDLKIATNPPDYAGNDFFKAREILIDSKPKFFTDFVGQPDNQDFYHFKLNEKRKFESLLYGLNGSASIELIQDSNNNGQFDASDLKIVSSSGSSEQKIKASLEPGDYYIRISPQQTNNNTYYNLDFSALIGPVAVLDFYTQPVPQYETDIDKEYHNFSGLLGNPTGGYAPATPSGNGTTGYWKGFDTGTIHWTPQYGAVALWHDFQNVYNQTGGSGGWLGFPTIDKYDWEGGQRIDFEGGYIFWTSNEGAKAYHLWESPWQLTSPDSGNSGSSSPIDGMIPYEFAHLGTSDDTLWEIARTKLGDGSRWQEILKPDGSSYTEDEARRISVGTIVYLPNYSNVNNGSSNNGGGSNSGNSGGNNFGGSNLPIQGKIPYVLGQRGTSDDSLWEIAQLTLDDGSRWQEILKPDGSNYTDEEATRIPAGTIVYLPEYANVGGTPGSSTPGSGTPGSGTPGGGQNGNGIPGSVDLSGGGSYSPIPGIIPPPVVYISSVANTKSGPYDHYVAPGDFVRVTGKSNTTKMDYYLGDRQVFPVVISAIHENSGDFTTTLWVPFDISPGDKTLKIVAKNDPGLTDIFYSNSWITVKDVGIHVAPDPLPTSIDFSDPYSKFDYAISFANKEYPDQFAQELAKQLVGFAIDLAAGLVIEAGIQAIPFAREGAWVTFLTKAVYYSTTLKKIVDGAKSIEKFFEITNSIVEFTDKTNQATNKQQLEEAGRILAEASADIPGLIFDIFKLLNDVMIGDDIARSIRENVGGLAKAWKDITYLWNKDKVEDAIISEQLWKEPAGTILGLITYGKEPKVAGGDYP